MLSGKSTAARLWFTWGLLVGLMCLIGLACPTVGHTTDRGVSPVDIEVFTRKGCPHCVAAKHFLEDLQRERPGLQIVIRDIGEDPEALARLKDLADKRGIRTVGLPAFYLRGELLIGYTGPETTGKRLKTLLDRPVSRQGDLPREGACLSDETLPCEEVADTTAGEVESIDTPFFGRLSVRAMGLPGFTIALGLLDGVNPCAVWVLLFLLSLLVNLQDRVMMALIAGTFVAVSGLAYFAFMAAWLNVFLLLGLSRAAQVLFGGIAVVIGAINVKDFFAFGQGVSLSIPEAAKPRLYRQVRRILQAESLPGALAGVIVLAVLVNLVELLCTAGFPMVYTQILTLRRLPWWEYYGYLALYNLAYIFDDGLMVTIAVATLSRSKLQERAGRWLKLAAGVVMVGLGIVLMWMPTWLGG